jgi:putative transposase
MIRHEFMGHYNHDRPHSFNDYLSLVKFERVRIGKINKTRNSLGTR